MSVTGNKLIAKNTVFLYLRMFIVLIVSLYTSRIIINTLGISDYGIYNVVAGFVSMFAFLNTALANGIQRFYNYENGKNGEAGVLKVYSTALIIQVLLAILILVLVEIVGFWYINNKMVLPEERRFAAFLVFHASVFSLVLVILQVPFSALVLSYEKFNFFAGISIVETLMKLIIVLILPIIHGYDKLIIYGLLHSLITLITFLAYYTYVKKKFCFIKRDGVFHRSLFREMLSFSGWNILGTFAIMASGQGLNMVLNLFFGPTVNAARAVSYQIKSAIQSLSQTMTASVRPQLTQAYAQGNYDRSISLMYSISKLCFFFLFFFAYPCSLEIDYVLDVWLKGTVPEYTAIFTRLVFLISLMEILNTPLSMIVHASGQMKNYQISTSIVSLMVIPISYFFLSQGASPVSVFIINVIVSLASQAVSVYIVSRIINRTIAEYNKKVIIPCFMTILAAFIFPLIVHCYMDESFLRLIIVCLLSAICTALSSIVLGLSRNEKSVVRQMIINRSKNM